MFCQRIRNVTNIEMGLRSETVGGVSLASWFLGLWKWMWQGWPWVTWVGCEVVVHWAKKFWQCCKLTEQFWWEFGRPQGWEHWEQWKPGSWNFWEEQGFYQEPSKRPFRFHYGKEPSCILSMSWEHSWGWLYKDWMRAFSIGNSRQESTWAVVIHRSYPGLHGKEQVI